MAFGIKPDGRREILGFWLFGAEGESARNWEEVLKDLKRRGVQQVRIFITDDLPGLEEAIKKIFPEADWQLCVLHAVRDALNKARKKDQEALAPDLEEIYWAETKEEAPEKPCGVCGSVGVGSIPRSRSGGRPRLMLFSRSCITLSPSAWNGSPRR